ncbi:MULTISPECIES: hypothetical protein [unclassified Saccharibacter]|uniref:hypothetical protein n=1 Tax=unclassified Saccharibacter TaxID=2648722 RepID=UPI001321568C|nr:MULTISPECIES: hypothetical protein [unclassified Saccharibacter]MXV36655.1 hypothetical protein [Saccharibacter sp. EH611]MXV58785.1 hypothetical protein [Saccharibacter sp. EH70]MXV65603.1 hypothetical protein [Saccharibacter sp. EH60]
MAERVLIRNAASGITRNGYIGFSWTYLFFGFLVPLIRGEILVAVLHAVLTAITGGFWQLFYCFFYNRHYMTRMLSDEGYVLADTPERNQDAAWALNITPPS